MINQIFKYVLIFILTITLGSNCLAANPPIYVDNLNDAMLLSKEISKEIVVIFSAEWCGHCKELKKDLNDNPAILEDKIICIIDISKDKNLSRKYKVKNIPDCRIIKNSIEIKKRIGYGGIDEFKKWLDQKD